MYNNNYDGDNGYRPGSYSYSYIPDLLEQPQPKKGKKVLKAIGCGLLALVFTATVSVGSIFGYVQLTKDDTLPAVQAGGPLHNTSSTVTQTIYVQPEISSKGVLTTAQVYQKALPSVVTIQCEVVQTTSGMGSGFEGFFGFDFGFGGQGSGQDQAVVGISTGTGFVYRSDGYILTNAHVVDGARKITVTLQDGKDYTAELIGSDAEIDLAVIKIEATGLTAVEFGDSDRLVVGEQAIVVGNPLGAEFANTCTQGIISFTGRAVELEDTLMDLIQVDAAVSPGNSGGPLFNNRGQVVGVINAKMADENVEGIGFAIPANTAKLVAQDFIDYGYYRSRPMIGMTVETVTEQQAAYYNKQAGVTVSEVAPGGAADLAGVQVGDKILAINGEKAETGAQLNFVKERSKVGDTITLTVERDGKQLQLQLVLQPASAPQQTEPAAPAEPSGGRQPLPQQP